MGNSEGPVLVRTSIEIASALTDGVGLDASVIAAGAGILTAVVAAVSAWTGHLERRAQRARMARSEVVQVLNRGEEIGRHVLAFVPITRAGFEKLNIAEFRIVASNLAEQNIEGTGVHLREIADLARRLADAAGPEQDVIVAASAGDSSAEDWRMRSISRQDRIAEKLIEEIEKARQILRSQP
ncbi:hypothetical protein ACWEGE_09400 [Amycolatopsis sp. NPDC004747]